MSECLHLHDDDREHIGSVCVPGPCQYLPRLHRTGAHTWEPVGEPVATIAEAFTVLGKVLQDEKGRSYRWYNRADILAVEPFPSYYEPHRVYEVRIG